MWHRLSTLFAIDIRSLALFRISTALILICDYINRFPYIRAHYTDWGILPRDILLSKFSRDWHLSIHFISGTWQVQTILIGIAILCAVALLVGYRTRLFTILSWFLLISLHVRNPVILQAGDVILRCFLFFGMFLPLGAAYSIDRALNDGDDPPQRVLSTATFAIMMQVCFVYWFTAVLKDHPIWREEYSAVYYALSLEQFTTAFGKYLLSFPELLKLLTFSTFWFEMIGPTIIFLPFLTSRIRLFLVPAFIGLHAGFALCMKLGLFPFISAAGWLVFLPSAFWDVFRRRIEVSAHAGLRIYYDGDCGFCKKMVLILRTFLMIPAAVEPAQSDHTLYTTMERENSWIVIANDGTEYYKFSALAHAIRCSPLFATFGSMLQWKAFQKIGDHCYMLVANNRDRFSMLTSRLHYRPLKWQLSVLGNIVAAFFIVMVFAWNVRPLDFDKYAQYFPTDYNWIVRIPRLDQKMNMFAPYPTRESGWFVIAGQLVGGREVDLWNNGAPVTYVKPPLVSATFPSQRWRKYMMNIWKKSFKDHRLYFGKYLCRSWNETHFGDEQLKTFQIHFMLEFTKPYPQQSATERRTIWRHKCF